MSNVIRRVLTALVFGPIILGLLYLGPAWGFVAFVSLATAIAAWELFGLTHTNDKAGRSFGTLLCVAFGLMAWFTRFGEVHTGWFALAAGGLAPLALLSTLARPARIPTALLEVGALVLGPLYVGGMMSTIPLMHATGTRNQGAGLVLFTLMIAWMGDTGGMLFGKNLGGPKLYPAVSPGKTWSGAFGGLLGSVLGALIAHFSYLPTLPLGAGIAVALGAGMLGQLGDLCESVLKRSGGVKDSGGILPGHGGFLDRIDALTFAASAVYLSLRAGWLVLG